MFVAVAKRTSLLDKQNSKCLSSNVCPFGQAVRHWSEGARLLDKHFDFACQECLCAGHHDKNCLTSTFCLSVFRNFSETYVCQAHANCVMAKPTNIVLDRQNFKCLSKGQTLRGKHLKFCLSSTMFVSLATTQTRA